MFLLSPAPDCFDDVTVIEEFDQAEENAFQIKYYANGTGNIKVGFRGDDASQEELELVKFETTLVRRTLPKLVKKHCN